MIPVSSVSVPSAAEGYVLEVLRSGHLAQGEFTERLEAGFADLCDVKHAVAVSNGTVSLELAAVALGIGPGDEVITSPFTFVATVNAMLNAGATVRFVDIDPVTYCLDVSQVEAAITPATVAIAPVHLYGLAADMAPLMAIALRHSLAIIEDAAQAHGALYKGARVGSFGVGSFSFYATKNMTTGEGGMVTTNDDAVADRLRLLRNQGMRARYEYEMVGRNARMTDLQAAVGTAELEILPERIERRRANAAGLTEQLDDLETLVVPFIPADREHVFHQYTAMSCRLVCWQRGWAAGCTTPVPSTVTRAFPGTPGWVVAYSLKPSVPLAKSSRFQCTRRSLRVTSIRSRRRCAKRSVTLGDHPDRSFGGARRGRVRGAQRRYRSQCPDRREDQNRGLCLDRFACRAPRPLPR